MLRSLHMLALALVATLGSASSATAITAETALRAHREISQPRVTDFSSQAREAHQQTALGYGENASDSSLASRAGAVTARSVGAAESAFSIASRGGRHAGFLRGAQGMTRKQLEQTARTFQKRIEIHEGYLDNPVSHVRNWGSLRPGHQQSLIRHWQQEIETFSEQQSIVQHLLGGL